MKSISACIISLATLATTTHAALLVYDPFDYSNNNTAFDGQSSTSRTGFANSDAWTVNTPGTSTVNFYSSPGSLSYSTLLSTGGHGMAFRNSGTTGFPRVHSLDSTTDFTNYASNEIWWSIIVNADGYNPTGSEYFEFNWDHQVTGGDRVFGFRLESSKTVLSRRYQSGSGTALDDTGQTLTSGDNLLLFRMTNNTGPVNGYDEVEMWLNPDLSSVGAADFSIEGNFFGLVQSNASYGFDRINVLYDFSADDSILIDEFRIGETLADVIPVPEPSTAMLMMITACGLLIRRR